MHAAFLTGAQGTCVDTVLGRVQLTTKARSVRRTGAYGARLQALRGRSKGCSDIHLYTCHMGLRNGPPLHVCGVAGPRPPGPPLGWKARGLGESHTAGPPLQVCGAAGSRPPPLGMEGVRSPTLGPRCRCAGLRGRSRIWCAPSPPPGTAPWNEDTSTSTCMRRGGGGAVYGVPCHHRLVQPQEDTSTSTCVRGDGGQQWGGREVRSLSLLSFHTGSATGVGICSLPSQAYAAPPHICMDRPGRSGSTPTLDPELVPAWLRAETIFLITSPPVWASSCGRCTSHM